jgi:hypothetical protein
MPRQVDLTKRLQKLETRLGNLKPELKGINFTSATNSTSTGAIVPLTLFAVGNTNDTRVGDRVQLKHINLRWAVANDTNNTFQRLIIFRDLSSDGAVPAVADVLGAVAYNATYDISNTISNHRFHIVRDMTLATSVNGPAAFHTNLELPLQDTVGFVDTTAAATALGTHQYYYLLIANSASTTSNIYWQIRFTDI